MKLTLFFKNIDHTPALDYRIEQKSEHLSKFFDGGFEVQWYCYAKTGFHSADICVIGPRYRLRATASDDNLYKCLDQVVDKMEKQLHKRKDKIREKIHRQKLTGPNFKDKQIKKSIGQEIRAIALSEDDAS